MRRADLLTGVALLTLAAIYYAQSLHIVRGFASDRLGPAFFPRLLAGTLTVLAIILIVRAGSGRSDPAPLPQTRTAQLASLIGLLVAYAVLMPHVGFLIATPVLLGAVVWLLGLRAWGALVGTALGMTAALYFLFGRALHVLLPTGLLK